CGKPKIKPFDGGSNRISKGREAVYGSAPWHVILREVKKDTTFCGGSLISADTVLTAAHCIGQFEMIFGYPFRPEYIQIFIGTHQCSGHNGTLLQIKNYYLHERYNDTHYNNDIAILKLERSVAMTDNVMPICLETPEFMEELLKPGRLGVITGCGSQFAHGPAPAHLHEVQ
ncbi:venom prothrombin activator oscutarin-C catalytic subunit, partial [Biomphalaria glabrata]